MQVTKGLTDGEPFERSTKGVTDKIWSTLITRLLGVALLLAVSFKFVPESYVLCSQAKNIYTVDQNNPRVECISVRGTRIVGVGNFGPSYDLRPWCLKLTVTFQMTFKGFITQQFYLPSSQIGLQGLLYRYQGLSSWKIMPLLFPALQARFLIIAHLMPGL